MTVSTEKKRINKLNELTGKEWIKFTKTWFIHNPPPRGKTKIRHPASFPETLIEEFIKFFTKRNQWVLDPFLGTGSTLVAAQKSMRNGIGIEIYPQYAEIARRRLTQKKLLEHEQIREIMIVGDSREIIKIFQENDFPKVDFCITSYEDTVKENVDISIATYYFSHMANPRTHFNTTLDTDLLKKLKFLAIEKNKRANDLLEEAIRDLLKKYEKKLQK